VANSTGYFITALCCVVDYFTALTVGEDSKMAASMRITAFVSLLLLLVSPMRTSAAQLPFPVVACLERCAHADADCVDACRRETEIETAEFPAAAAAEKRASAFVRIGRPSAVDRRASSFIRIGKSASPMEVDADKRKDSFVRIGRASAFVRIGRGGGGAGDEQGSKRASSFVRIGKSSSKPEEDSAVEVETTGDSKRASSSFVRIGRGDREMGSDERWHHPRRW